MKSYQAWVLLSALATALCGTAARAAPPGAILILRDATHVVIHGDGRVVETRFIREQAKSEAGAVALRRLAIPFNSGWEKVRVLASSEITPGSGYEIPSVHILKPISETAAPAYAPQRVAEVRFHHVVTGTIVQAEYERVASIQDLPGAFGLFRLFDRTQPIASAHVEVRFPASLKLYAEGNNGSLLRKRQGRRRIILFSIRHVAPLVDVASPSERMEKSPYLAVSIYPSVHREIKAYAAKLQKAEHMTLELQHLADTLGQGDIDPTSLMHRYYAWINDHIRLIDLPLDLENAQPRSAQQILLSRYGSPQDRIILLQALMRAKAIATSLVLVPRLPLYWHPVVQPMPAFLGKVMLAANSNSSPLDIGSPFISIGEVAPGDAGKFGYSVGPNGGVDLLRIPFNPIDSMADAVRTTLTISPGGDLSGVAVIADYGALGNASRLAFLTHPLRSLRDRITRYAGGMAADVAIHTRSDPSVPAARFVYGADINDPNYVTPGSMFSTSIPRPAVSLHPMADFVSQTGPGLCLSTVREEQTTINVIGARSMRAPHDVRVIAPGGVGRYIATYQIGDHGHVLYVDRTLDLTASPSQCDPKQQRALEKLARSVRADLNAQMEIELPAAESTGERGHG